MEKVTSADGTEIAFDQLGEGPPLVLVAGASCDRSIDLPLATVLAEDFTVLNYDRRGRGDSGDTPPFAVEHEVDDIEAMLAAGGGGATLVGLSSVATLAASAAARGLPIDTLVMWEPPFSVDADQVRLAKEYADELDRLLAAGRRGDALAHFMRSVGLPEGMIDGMRHSPYWQLGESLAPTLAYDAAAMGDSTVPVERYGQINVPTLVLAGSESPELMRTAATRAAVAIPGAKYEVLVGQDHNVAGEALAPVLVKFREGRRP